MASMKTSEMSSLGCIPTDCLLCQIFKDKRSELVSIVTSITAQKNKVFN